MFTVTGEDLEAETREECSENGTSGLSTLLSLIIDSKKAKDEEGGEERMSGRCVTEDRPLGNQKAAEKGLGLEERGTVNRKDVNIGGFGDVLCQATCVLRPDILVCVTK